MEKSQYTRSRFSAAISEYVETLSIKDGMEFFTLVESNDEESSGEEFLKVRTVELRDPRTNALFPIEEQVQFAKEIGESDVYEVDLGLFYINRFYNENGNESEIGYVTEYDAENAIEPKRPTEDLVYHYTEFFFLTPKSN